MQHKKQLHSGEADRSDGHCRYSYTSGVWKAMSQKVIFYMFLAAVSVALKMSFAFLVSEIVDGAVSFEMNRLQRLFLVLIVFLIVRYLTSRLYSRARFTIIEYARSYMRENLVHRFLHLPLYLGQQFENYENFVVTNVDMVIDDYYKSVLDLVENCFTFAVALLILMHTNLFITLNILIFAVLQIMIPKIYSRFLSDTRKKYSEIMDKHYCFLREFARIRSLFYSKTLVNREEKLYRKTSEALRKSAVEKDGVGANMRILTFVLSQFMYLSTMILGAYFAGKGYMSVGMVVAASQFMNYITSPLSEMISSLGMIRASTVARDKIQRIYDLPQEEESQEELFSGNAGEVILELRHISWMPQEDGDRILNDISLTVNKREKILVIGESGAGKSTLAKIITREILSSEGKILLDSREMDELDDSMIHKQLSCIPAQPLVFDGTVDENLSLCGSVLETEKRQMLRRFGIHADLEQKAEKCSLGELQRICVIRALLERRPLIIADESTAHLDRENQNIVEETLLSAEGALIYIAHNYSREVMERFDRVVELKNGKIVCDGVPQKYKGKREYFHPETLV